MYIAVGIRSPSEDFVPIAQPNATSLTQPTGIPVQSSGIHISSSARSLIGFLTVLGAILLGFAAWKIRSYLRQKKARAVPARLSFAFKTSEKPSLVSLSDSRGLNEPSKATLQPPIPSTSPTVGWTTQVRSVRLPTGVTVPPVAITAPSRSPQYQDEYPPTPHSGPSVPPYASPPPYRVLGLQTVLPPPPPPDTAATAIPPPTPMMSKKFPEPVSTPLRESFDLPPVPSPRSASFNTSMDVPPVPRSAMTTVFDPKALPRLMLVSTAFRPTRDDELAMSAGETLRLLKEFEDGWCLVQRVGRSDAEKGVVPRFCLIDRPRVTKGRVSLTSLTFNGIRRK